MSAPTLEPINGPIPPILSQPPAPQNPPVPEYRFTQEDLEKARREEKEKVYSRLEQVHESNKALSSQVELLLAEQNARKEAEEAARREAEEAERKAAEAQMDARTLLEQKEQEWKRELSTTTQEWQQKFETFAQERAAEQALLEKERQFASLAAYTANRVADAKDEIAPQFLDFIKGNNEAEVDAAIETAKAKTAEILAEVQNQIQQQRAQQRGVAPTGFTPSGSPLDIPGQRQYSSEDIQNMSMDEYKNFRQQAGIGGQQSNRGLYG